MTNTIDLITLEVLWNRLLSVVNEQQVTLMRTAFSTVVRESQDLACGVFDTRGAMVAQSLTGTPGHINAMATGVRHCLDEYPPETLQSGDVLLTNDPWQTAGQINDMTVLTPVFKDARLVAYFASTCHAPDIGGRLLSGEAREIYEEGLRIPITKLFIRDEPNRELLKIIRANVRTPDETVGDLYAQTSSNAVGARELLHFMDEFGLDSIDPLADAIISRSEQAMREAIRALPNGRYENEAWSDGFDEPIRIKVAVTVADEDIFIDFAGSSPQSPWGINVVLNYTHAYASFAIKAAITPEIPHNAGSFRPVHVSAPAGSILNCIEPAAVASRHLIGHFLPSVIFGAMAQAMPTQLIACGADPIWIAVWRGSWSTSHKPFTFSLFQCGGTGARASKDGLNTTGFPSGVAGVPTEVMESYTPLVQYRRALRTDSGGAGTYRGGLGQWTEVRQSGAESWAVSAMADRIHFPATGLAHGKQGAPGEFLLNGEAGSQPKAVRTLASDTHVQLNLPGGGGYGDPFQRPIEMVLHDVVNGYVSLEAARREYGVVIRYTGSQEQLVRPPELYVVDEAATASLRAADH
ncbi:hydantoinase [Reticulibacter mediterranei]|uniref:Hydantoinase n=1 Tax=Reticulibacter mediterranei TaxID=2778369 RepID=A0A8J3IJS3_9CHLR|nr:hydantoinase B/oxoprolinase family protein [Reticulibacter mediterranei]GHO93748.1 hydantoinase [Reticulibacter mediterranei]